MNEVQKALQTWIKFAYSDINAKVESECDLFGFKKEMFEDGEVELIHNVKPSKIEGSFQATYGVKKGNHITNILTVEFNINGFVMYGHRKTHIIKKALINGRRLNMRRV